MNRQFLTAATAAVLCTVLVSVSEGARTVPASERGLFYALPYQCKGQSNCTDWSGVGAYLGQFTYQYYYDRMEADTLKLLHGRFQHFAVFDNYTEALFPYAHLLQYDAAEVAAGRPSLFVSATWRGMKRPVIFTWYGHPDPLYVTPGRAVNLKDPRFVEFWVTKYVQRWQHRINKPNMYILLDNCTFEYDLYGVADDDGTFVPGVVWDYPYVQSHDEFLESIDNFFVQVRRIDPTIKMICNTDAAAPPDEFVTAYRHLDGIGIENMERFYESGDDWSRSKFYDQFTNAAWAADAGKIGIMNWHVQNDAGITAAMRRNYMHYLMVRGDNFFFAPQFYNRLTGEQNEVGPEHYETMRTALGLPTGATSVLRERGRPPGYNLYSRRTTGGIAYLNWSGVTKTIALPPGRYVNSAGKPITTITIPDMAGDYVLFQ